MKTRSIHCWAAAAALLSAPLASATTHTFYVAEGETISLDAIAAASNVTAFAKSDRLVKTGPGTLTASATLLKSVPVTIDICEGVYALTKDAGKTSQYGGTCYVRDGATLKICPGVTQYFSAWLDLFFTGSGTGVGENLGAIVVTTAEMNAILHGGTKFHMTGDATIYTASTMNAVFSATSEAISSKLYMYGHTLTILNKDANAVFRPRWAWAIDGSGPIVFKNGQFARHKTTNSFNPYLPLVSFKDGALMASYGDPSLWNQVDAFDFEFGTKIAKGKQGESGVTMTLARVTGPVEISSDATVTISQQFSVRQSDLAAGNSLKAANTLTFAPGCALALAECSSSFTPGASYTAATSDTAISGTPVLSGAAASIFTLENTGKTLVLTVKADSLVLKTGEENAAANSAEIERYAATLADGGAVWIPDAEYHFARPLDFSAVAVRGLTIASLAGRAVLHAGLTLGAASDVTVKSLTFRECAEPAVVATNTVALTVTNCTLERVLGDYSDGVRVPFAAVNVTDLTITQNEFEFDDLLWSAQAYLEGGSQTPTSEARAGEVVFYAPDGLILDNWWNFTMLTNRLGLTAAAYSGRVLRKIGPAALDINDQNCDPGTFGIDRVIIESGQFVVRTADSLGRAGSDVVVTNRGTLSLYKASNAVINRRVRVSGMGDDGGENPAIRFTGTAEWNKTDNAHWFFDGDATMYNNCSGECGTFLRGAVTLNGHTLTLTGKSGSNYRFGRTTKWTGGGTVVAKSPVIVSASRTDDAEKKPSAYVVTDGIAPRFVFEKGTTFMPDNNDILQLVSKAEFEVGSAISRKASMTAFSPAFADLTGAPAVDARLTGLSVTNSLTARFADLAAGNALSLAGENQTLVLGKAGARITVTLADENLAAPTANYTLAEAAGGILGPKPKLDAAAKALGWGIWRDGTRLVVGPRKGTFVIVR